MADVLAHHSSDNVRQLAFDGDQQLDVGFYFLWIVQPHFVLNGTNCLVYIYSKVRLLSVISPRRGTSNKTFEEPGHRWAFPGRQTHSPVCGRKEDKAFYSINRRKTRPFGPCRAQGEGPGKGEGGRLVPAVCRQPRHMSSLLHSIPCQITKTLAMLVPSVPVQTKLV